MGMIFIVREVLADKTVSEQEMYVFAENTADVERWAQSKFDAFELAEAPSGLVERKDCHVDLVA